MEYLWMKWSVGVDFIIKAERQNNIRLTPCCCGCACWCCWVGFLCWYIGDSGFLLWVYVDDILGCELTKKIINWYGNLRPSISLQFIGYQTSDFHLLCRVRRWNKTATKMQWRWQHTRENLSKFYHYSPLNCSMLNRSCDSLNVKFLVPPRVGGTQRLPHMRCALDNLWVTYPAIIEHCQQLQNAADVRWSG